MLIICEDCAKRYNIDESRIKSSRARFTCKECGHIIIVEKSDFSRRLISAAARPATQGTTGTFDLFREMEESAGPSLFDETSSQNLQEKPDEGTETARKDLPILVYFLLALLAAFLCTSVMLAYLYTATIGDILQETGSQAEFLTRSILLLGMAWILAGGIFYIIALSLARPITKLKEDIVRFDRGKQGRIRSFSGPREVRELADVLSRITRTGQ